MQTQKSFAQTIKGLREARGLPLREVAEALGIDTSMLSKIEKGSRRPTQAFIQNAALFFGVEKASLLVAFLSDTIAYQVKDAEEALEVLKVAEAKVKYLRKTQKPQP